METTNTRNEIQLLTAKELGVLLSLSKRQIFRLNSCGKIPKPVRIGGSVRWISAEISAWIMASCPDRDTWEVMKAAAES
jgi:predicted DNA-binding transcriptional regulator AlpA